MSKKQKQRLLIGNGTLEDREQSLKMLMQLFEAMFERPIIGHTVWVHSITEEQKFRIKAERMKQVKEANGEPITEATDYEAMVYVSTASLAEPLSQTWFRIYAYLFRKFYPEQANGIFEENEGHVLQSYEESQLRDLKRWLYKTSKEMRNKC